jgi:hypothetical protein
MNKAKINELYEKAYVTYEVPYESSVVDPTIVSVHKQKVWDRYLFAELIVRECCLVLEQTQTALDRHKWPTPSECGIYIKEHFGVEE